ncbi:TPA: hypothetical protein ACF39K_001995 [Vibrio parahaemolyticus]|nr:hypothetical protein [Vibrio parahaemolyticus]
MSKFEELSSLLEAYGQEIEHARKAFPVNSIECLDSVPDSQGVYWIETTMPISKVREAISELNGKEKNLRVKPPIGTSLITQVEAEPIVIYSGTENNLNSRLKQHLFNLGSKKTAKLGCIISQPPFDSYEWFVSYAEIDSYELRYAVEAWWRLNMGWPQFCLR